MVLATDMAKHFDILTTLQSKVIDTMQQTEDVPTPLPSGGSALKLRGVGSMSTRRASTVRKLRNSMVMHSNSTQNSFLMESKEVSFASLDAEQQKIVLQAALKLADLGNTSMPIPSALPWVVRLQ